MMFFLFLVALFFLLILSIDLVPDFWIWQSRIKIGQFAHEALWKDKVLQKSIFWLNHLPKTKIKDENHLIVIDILKNQYTNSTLQSWQEASLLLGLHEAYQKNESSKIKAEILKFVDSKIDKQGQWISEPKEIDAGLLAFALSEISFLEQNIKPALDSVYQLIISKLGEDETVIYRSSTPNYRYVDSIGFVCPFLTKYGVEFQNEEALQLAISQIKNFEKFGMLENKIPCHAYEIHTKNPVGIFGWGRGLAWFLIGVLETYKVLPEQHPEKKYLQNLLEQIAETLVTFQKNDGSFSWNLMDSGARRDSSATAVFAWFLQELNFKVEVQKSLQYLQSVTQRNGAVDFSQGDTKSIGVYSQKFEILPFTQGFLLQALYK
ncbi:hypothetical protein GCM10010992_27260 [Cloacibacterium rupense]|uniref:Unsaturated rhamnogalacturonyl hydrolase n=1 Tax=Cloacibacterium rupense TaxID=517423 RepID=A0ABQ2NNK5_9FLAO|nr:glycoside hydrolase family 88 protein [Cloacibacterium rupense]GGP06603.1 hypothetical protein GCM10010992_27260 [Cloacibacterium rupense]